MAIFLVADDLNNFCSQQSPHDIVTIFQVQHLQISELAYGFRKSNISEYEAEGVGQHTNGDVDCLELLDKTSTIWLDAIALNCFSQRSLANIWRYGGSFLGH
ncbi:uncharacterized protein LOC110262784 [Arachis ipaensis]|uniref:uncharacterized protein LOC110262784 n=1 Tax=Arachis ipaensis TaxID=130454 RepID=UPI000A2B5921|nr:uncharacterized protein LOC110262784 [Arachis ipaensis]QHO11617.1 uncharacterized protein DS421_15g499650 [Arachis hypogaea]